ncbi:hypothetical protein [Kitasatospora sp. NPDC057015]|uniref:hypothetical protein n=1 Tax=Kitasatospora sp. NPDC057015 TaxID=3346001 RepID=UPI003640D3E4
MTVDERVVVVKAATGELVPAEVGRLVAAGWVAHPQEEPDGTVSVLSPDGKSIVRLESTDDYVRANAADLDDEPARREMAPAAESNPGAILAILERIAR